MRYIIAPLDLSDEQSHIYKLLYKKSDFKTMIVKYTKGQLLLDSNPLFKLTTQKIRTILDYFIKENLIKEIEKGSKGNPTVYEIISIKELMFEQQLNNNNPTTIQQLNNNNDVGIEPTIEVKQQLNNNKVTTIQQLNNNPIKDKDNEEGKRVINLGDFYENPLLNETVKEFIKMRKLIKKPMTPGAIKLMIGKLNKLADNDADKITILNNSVENSWQGIFELKGGVKTGTDIKQNQATGKVQYDFSRYGG